MTMEKRLDIWTWASLLALHIPMAYLVLHGRAIGILLSLVLVMVWAIADNYRAEHF